MTKKELIESETWRLLPDDAEIVFRTNGEARHCSLVMPEELEVVGELTNPPDWDRIPEHMQFDFFKRYVPKYKTFLVINGIGWKELEHKYRIKIKF